MIGRLSARAVVLASRARPGGSDHRRLRLIARDPRRATANDIELLVRAHGVPEAKVWAVTDRMEAAALDPATVWSWTMDFDGTELAELCGSSLGDGELALHLAAGTVPDRASLVA